MIDVSQKETWLTSVASAIVTLTLAGLPPPVADIMPPLPVADASLPPPVADVCPSPLPVTTPHALEGPARVLIFSFFPAPEKRYKARDLIV